MSNVLPSPTFAQVTVQDDFYEAITTGGGFTFTGSVRRFFANAGGTIANYEFEFLATPPRGTVLKIFSNVAISAITYNGNGTTIGDTLPTSMAAGTSMEISLINSNTWERTDVSA